MKAEHINPFIASFEDIMKNMLMSNVSIGKPYLRENPILVHDLVIIIGVTGGIKGQVLISMSENSGKKIASQMMMGMEVKEFDEISKSAVAEIGNMILGTSATKLSKLGLIIDITPPNIIIGDNMSLSSSIGKHITIPFDSDLGQIDMDISFKY